MALSDLEKIKHWMRRLGLGVSAWELQSLAGMKPEAALDRMLQTPKGDFGHPFQFAVRAKEEPDLGTWRFARFWALQFGVTSFPFREKMSVFWHDHFAVSDGTVENGMMMLEYLQAIRRNPAGKFHDILNDVVRTAAFLRMLDVDSFSRDEPNENFARELLELYTLGEGHYTESDIKEVARAFTGWSYDVLYYKFKGNDLEKLKKMVRTGTPASTFLIYADVQDTGPKTILGKKGNWNGQEVLDILANHPRTVRHICEKLWSFFGAQEPSEACIAAMGKTWQATDGDIRAVVKTMALHSEFNSPEVVGKLIKSPVEFCYGMMRCMNSRQILQSKLPDLSDPLKPLPEDVFDSLGTSVYHLEHMGQDLLWPPDVSGWKWHKEWINTALILQRKRFRGIYTWEPYMKDGKEEWRPAASTRYVCDQIKLRRITTPKELAGAVAQVMDCELSSAKLDELGKSAIPPEQVAELLKHDGWLGGVVSRLIDLIAFTPEYQVH